MAGPKLEGRFVASSPEQIRDTTDALAVYTRDAGVAPDLTGQPGKFRVVTKVWSGLLLASIAALFVGGEVPIMFGVFGLVFFIPALILTGVNDLLQPSPRDRATPEAALRCFFRGVRGGRWKAAFAALGAPARQREATVPRIKALQSERGTVTMGDPKRVERYWRTLARPSKNMHRRISGFDLEPLDHTGDVRRYRVTVDFKTHKMSTAFFFGILGQLATTKKFRTAYEVYVYRHKSQWWLYSGELGLPEKVAMLPEARIVE